MSMTRGNAIEGMQPVHGCLIVTVPTAIEADGYRVLRAYGGAEAIEAARRALPKPSN